jgi:hypothetical protein
MSEAVRRRTDLFAKSIAGLGTAALTAIGIAKFADVYPLPPFCHIPAALWVALVATVGGFAAMGLALVWFSRGLWKVTEAVFMPLEPPEQNRKAIGGLDEDEAARVRDVYEAAAQLHGAKTLAEYAKQAATLDGDADKKEDKAARAGTADTEVRAAAGDAARLRVRAQAIRANVDEAQARAVLNVVRMRAHRAVRNWGPILCFLPGLVAFGLGADYLDSEHSASLRAAKTCVSAIEAVRDGSPATGRLLPAICGNDPLGDENKPPEAADRSKDEARPQVSVIVVGGGCGGCRGTGGSAGREPAGSAGIRSAAAVCTSLVQLLAQALGIVPAPASAPASAAAGGGG